MGWTSLNVKLRDALSEYIVKVPPEPDKPVPADMVTFGLVICMAPSECRFRLTGGVDLLPSPSMEIVHCAVPI